MRYLARGVILLLLFAAPQIAYAADADNTYLDGLVGDWTMNGTLLGKPVQYAMHGEHVLQGGFVSLHMVDAHKPPQYESDAFLGYDANKKDYVCHWLDRFGAAGARVVGTGTRTGNRLVLLFPYEDGAFQDVFVFDPRTRTWSILMQTQGKNGAWSLFAAYAITKR